MRLLALFIFAATAVHADTWVFDGLPLEPDYLTPQAADGLYIARTGGVVSASLTSRPTSPGTNTVGIVADTSIAGFSYLQARRGTTDGAHSYGRLAMGVAERQATLTFNYSSNALVIDAPSIILTGDLSMPEKNLSGVTSISYEYETRFIDLETGQLVGTWVFDDEPTIPGYLTATGAAATYATTSQLSTATANAQTPVTVSTSGALTINLGAKPLHAFLQVGAITNIVLSYDTNKVTFAEVLLYANGSAITWPTNNVTWKPYLPDAASNKWQSILFRSHRGKVQAAYVESYD